jgi:hypothetical protein
MSHLEAELVFWRSQEFHLEKDARIQVCEEWLEILNGADVLNKEDLVNQMFLLYKNSE